MTTPPRRTIRSRLHSAWRYSFLFFAWNLTRTVVFLSENVRPLRWLGSSTREIGLRLWHLAWLTLVWVLLWGDLHPGTIIAGLVVAVAISLLLPLPRVPVEGRVHLFSVAVLLYHLIIDLVWSSFDVAWYAIRPQKPPLSAVLRTKMAIKSDMVLTLVVDYLNLVPGTMVVEIDHRRRLLYVHLIDAGSEAKVRKFYDQMAHVEKWFIRAFERDSEWHPSPYHGIDDEPASTTGRKA